jgi:hypothetical protein
MAKFKKKPVVVEAHQWFENGDHPDDNSKTLFEEGDIVRYFRRPEPEYAGIRRHDRCGRIWHSHGWIDTLEGGHTVCPGDWILTGVQGEHYPCKPDIFEATYESADTEACECCGQQREELPFTSRNDINYCQVCWDVGCDLVECSVR